MKTTNSKKNAFYTILLAAAMALPLAAHGGEADMAEEGGAPMPPGGPACHPGMGPGMGDERGMHGAGPEGLRMAPGMPGMPPFGMGGMGAMAGGEPPFLRALDLSEAQQDKVFAILHAQVPYLREQAKAAGRAHEALRELSRAAQYDDSKASALVQAGAQAEANIMLQHLRTEQKVLAVLTPEQRKLLAESRPQRKPRM